VEPAGLRIPIIMLRHITRTHANLHLMVKHITSQDSFLIRGRSECRKGLSESVKVVENCSCQTMIFKASAQTGATMSSEEK
jgi:hypothetical protein